MAVDVLEDRGTFTCISFHGIVCDARAIKKSLEVGPQFGALRMPRSLDDSIRNREIYHLCNLYMSCTICSFCVNTNTDQLWKEDRKVSDSCQEMTLRGGCESSPVLGIAQMALRTHGCLLK